MNNYGGFAEVGDFVEMLRPDGEPSGLHGVVVGEHNQPAIVPKRILHVLITWSTGAEVEHFKDSFVRIVGKS